MQARRLWFGLMLLGLSATAHAGDPAPAAPVDVEGFWTKDELARIDRGLEILNLDRRDLGFQKRPIDDAFRLEVVNRALDDPLSVGVESASWDATARRGDPTRLLVRARSALGLKRGGELPAGTSPVVVDAGVLPEPIRSPFLALVDGLQRAVPALERARASLGDAPDPLLGKALRTQVEKPSAALPAGEVADDAFLAAVSKVQRSDVLDAAQAVTSATDDLVAAIRSLGPDGFVVPTEGLKLWTGAGAVVFTAGGDDVHDEGDDVCCVIDLGGNDFWKRGASAYGKRPVSVCIDLGGDDRWGNGQDLSCAGALGGIAIQYDAGNGNDVYTGGHASCGAAVLGVSVLVDEGGDDVYRVKDFGIGAGAFGVGILLDKGGNDLYHDDLYGEGFASTWGCGVLVDLAGNDTYDAGGVHSDAPLHRDRTQSLSQGFSIGMRPDASGGVGVLVDVTGNDHYAADIYGQGASYWFSLGLLIDDEGNDTYVLGHYGQGAGIHLSAGMLLDRAGQDVYYDQYGVGVGGAHDYAVGFLVDRGGDDNYCGSGASMGSALTNSVAMLLDDGGDDGYMAVHPDGSNGVATPARDTGGIALFLDGGGKDAYGEGTRDGKAWATGLIGAGLDEPLPPEAGKPADPMGAEISKEAATAIVDKDGRVPLNDGTRVDDLDALWKIGIRWQVGDERVIGPIARERLVALGAPTLARAIEKLGTKDGLEFECIQAVLPKFPRETVLARLLEATKSADVPVRKGALRMLITMVAVEAEARLVEMLADADVRGFVLRALAALKKAPPAVAGYLKAAKEPEGVAAAVCLGAEGGEDSIAALVGALSTTTAFPVRLAAEQQLASLGDKAVPALAKAALGAASVREKRSALRALGGTRSKAAIAPVFLTLFDASDPWLRLSARLAAEQLVRDLPNDATADLARALEKSRAAETDPLLMRMR
jgi:HEAT repeat protein